MSNNSYICSVLIILNIDNMKKIKSQPQFNKFLKDNPFNVLSNLSDGFIPRGGIETIEIDIEDEEYYSWVYPDQETLYRDVLHNLHSLDLTSGGDDQYYDYNPAIVESILYSLPQLTQEQQDVIIRILQEKLEAFCQDSDQDDELIEQYEYNLEKLNAYSDDHRETDLFHSLTVSEIF